MQSGFLRYIHTSAHPWCRLLTLDLKWARTTLDPIYHPVVSDTHRFFAPELDYHLEVKIPWRFQVEADSPEEAAELVTRAVKKRRYLDASEDGAVQGHQTGEIEVVSNLYLPTMSVGDNPFDEPGFI